jgi:hypothetical protein
MWGVNEESYHLQGARFCILSYLIPSSMWKNRPGETGEGDYALTVSQGSTHTPGQVSYAILVGRHGFLLKVPLMVLSHRIRDEFPCVIVPDKHHDFVVRHCLLVLVL